MSCAVYWLRYVLVVSVLLVLAGCAAAPKPPPPPKPTLIQATVSAASDVNPDSRGRPSPIVVRMFELKSLAAFEGADFFSLYERDRDTLGGEMLAREDFQLSPGDQRKFERQLQADTRYVAVIAAYRDLERAKWRGSMSVAANQTTPLLIRLDSRSVSIAVK